MALGMKAAAVIVTFALIGTIFIAAVDLRQEPTTTTTYEQVTDLTPLVTYESVDSYKDFNPTQNVTGWSNVTYQLSSNTTTFPIVNTHSTATETRVYLKTMYSNAVWFNGTANRLADISGNTYTASSGVPDGKTMIGGIAYYNGTGGYNEYSWVYDVYTTPTTVGSHTLWIVYLNDYLATFSKPVVITSDDLEDWQFLATTDEKTDYVYQTESTYAVFRVGTEDAKAHQVALPEAGLVYDPDTNYFYTMEGYDTLGNPVYDDRNPYVKYVYICSKDGVVSSQNTNPTFTVTAITPGEYSYVSQYKFVTISDGAYAHWSNGYDNGKVQIVTEPGAVLSAGGYTFTMPDVTSQYPYVLVTLDTINKEYYAQGIVKTWGTGEINLSDLTTVDYRYPLTVTRAGTEVRTFDTFEDYIDSLTYIEGYYTRYYEYAVPLHYAYDLTITEIGEAIQWDVDGSGAVLTAVGNGKNIHIADLYENVTITVGHLSGTTYEIELRPGVEPTPTETIDLSTVSVTNASKAYVTSTTVPADPLGQLWGNPVIDVQSKFPDVFADGARVMISGYVTAGDSVTVNGQTFAIVNGYLQYPTETKTETYNFKGTAIDYRTDGHTYLVFTEYNNKTIDLGETTDTTVSFGGTWYFTSALDSINTTQTTRTVFEIGKTGADSNTILFVFIGLLVLGALVASYMYRGGISVLDWIIILVAGAFALVLVS